MAKITVIYADQAVRVSIVEDAPDPGSLPREPYHVIELNQLDMLGHDSWRKIDWYVQNSDIVAINRFLEKIKSLLTTVFMGLAKDAGRFGKAG